MKKLFSMPEAQTSKQAEQLRSRCGLVLQFISVYLTRAELQYQIKPTDKSGAVSEWEESDTFYLPLQMSVFR